MATRHLYNTNGTYKILDATCFRPHQRLDTFHVASILPTGDFWLFARRRQSRQEYAEVPIFGFIHQSHRFRLIPPSLPPLPRFPQLLPSPRVDIFPARYPCTAH